MTRESPRVRRLPVASLIGAAVGMLLAARRGHAQDSRCGISETRTSSPSGKSNTSGSRAWTIQPGPAAASERCRPTAGTASVRARHASVTRRSAAVTARRGLEQGGDLLKNQ